MKPPGSSRFIAATAVILLTGMLSNAPTALALEPPSVDPALVPPDGTPGPERAMRQSNVCARAIAVATPDVGKPAPGPAMLNINKAWQYSTGNGVAVASDRYGCESQPASRLSSRVATTSWVATDSPIATPTARSWHR
jgi:membrane-anchored mycosin MYCP